MPCPLQVQAARHNLSINQVHRIVRLASQTSTRVTNINFTPQKTTKKRRNKTLIFPSSLETQNLTTTREKRSSSKLNFLYLPYFFRVVDKEYVMCAMKLQSCCITKDVANLFWLKSNSAIKMLSRVWRKVRLRVYTQSPPPSQNRTNTNSTPQFGTCQKKIDTSNRRFRMQEMIFPPKSLHPIDHVYRSYLCVQNTATVLDCMQCLLDWQRHSCTSRSAVPSSRLRPLHGDARQSTLREDQQTALHSTMYRTALNDARTMINSPQYTPLRNMARHSSVQVPTSVSVIILG